MTWQLEANGATIVSAVVALLALIFGAYQFGRSMESQREALRLQQQAIQSDRASKAADIFAKYLDVAHSRPPTKVPEEARQFRFERDNRALLLLNTLSLVAKDDQEWQEIVGWSLYRYKSFAEGRNVMCLDLTREFRTRLERMVVTEGAPICRDMTE